MIEDTHYKVFKILETNPAISQRELAEELGVSLGKTNYCLKALIDKGLLKTRNFKNSDNKRAYLYVLTPHGIEAKAKISVRFLARKLAEYEALKAEIEQLKAELDAKVKP
jgi:EPS-associated MarR family transcriptional regulator